MKFTQGNVTMRVDGDVFEVLTPNNTARIPLDRLQVCLHRTGKSAYLLAVGQSRYVDKDRQPLPPGLPRDNRTRQRSIGRDTASA
ncbi:MAG: hypothetical protein ACLPZR_05005 [Solirubrobacteraceae bacterium]